MNKNRALKWVTGGDTGVSSLTIWAVMMGVKPEHGSYPYDPSDFGRCYRLLKLMPEWRSRLREVVMDYPEWRDLVHNWDELEKLFEEESPSGTCPKLYRRMQELIPHYPVQEASSITASSSKK